MPLTVKEIDNAAPGPKNRKLSDGKGLFLLITPAGSKTWHFKYRFGGKEKKLSLGAYPDVTLKSARSKRDDARATLAQGVDPSQQRQAQRRAARFAAENTFSAIAHELIAKRADDGDDAICDVTKEKTLWLLSLLEPTIGKAPVRSITAPQLLAVLQDIQKSGRKETARRLRSFAGRVFNYAIITGRAENNPATALQRALPTPKTRSHPAIIDRDQLGRLLRKIDSYGGTASTKAALALSPHVFQRPGEVRTMRWADVDLAAARWIIPASNTKMRRQHEVPLSRQSVKIIGSRSDVAGYSEFVFPSFNPKRPLSENAVNGALRRMGYAGIMTAHGFRSTASSLLNESNRWNPDAIERALAHQDGNAVRAVYNRTAYWAERVEMAQWWSDELEALQVIVDR